MLGIIFNGLLDKKSTIRKLKGASYGGGNLSFHFNPSIIAFTPDPPSKSTSSTTFLPT
jgi:hypothetical protein